MDVCCSEDFGGVSSILARGWDSGSGSGTIANRAWLLLNLGSSQGDRGSEGAGTRVPCGSGSVVAVCPPLSRFVAPCVNAPGSPARASRIFAGGVMSENGVGVAGSALTRSV